MKRGQISIFIILAVVIIVGILLIGYFIKKNNDNKVSEEFFENIDVKPSLDKIENSIFDCVNKVSEESLESIAVQGGYYNAPDNYFDLGWTFVPYFYYNKIKNVPDIDVVESELKNYVQDNIYFCLNEINVKDFDLSYNVPDVDVKILGESVEFNVDMKVVVKKEKNSIQFDLNNYKIVYYSSLKNILELSNYIVDSYVEDSENICIDCLVDRADEKDVYVDLIEFEDDSTIVIISENKYNKPYAFEFLIK